MVGDPKRTVSRQDGPVSPGYGAAPVVGPYGPEFGGDPDGAEGYDDGVLAGPIHGGFTGVGGIFIGVVLIILFFFFALVAAPIPGGALVW